MLVALPEAHALTAAAVAAARDVEPARGLTTTEVRARAATGGPNELEPARRGSVLGMIVESATEPFVLLLLAAGVGAILLGEVRDGLLVLAGLVPIIGADVVTEYRGERALEALRDASAPRATVRRDGAVGEVAAAHLVPGDIVLLRAGDIVPADLRLLSADRLLLDRSALTGESVPEPGAVVPDAPDTPLAERRSMAYAGSPVLGGRAEGVVVAIGSGTEVGRIASGLTATERRRSPLQSELDRLVRLLLVVAIALIVIVTGLGFLRGQPAGANVLAAIAQVKPRRRWCKEFPTSTGGAGIGRKPVVGGPPRSGPRTDHARMRARENPHWPDSAGSSTGTAAREFLTRWPAAPRRSRAGRRAGRLPYAAPRPAPAPRRRSDQERTRHGSFLDQRPGSISRSSGDRSTRSSSRNRALKVR